MSIWLKIQHKLVKIEAKLDAEYISFIYVPNSRNFI